MTQSPQDDRPDVISDHRRQWKQCLYVYPVIARRSKGLSIGVNLNGDKRCNFACLYCQVNRRIGRNLHRVDIDVLASELDATIDEITTGRLWEHPRFSSTSQEMRRINDIAFSGDGEPTCLIVFDRAVATAASAKARAGLDDVKIVVISNASAFRSEQFIRSLPILDANNGEIWAKLDAGSEQYFQRMNRPHSKIFLQQIMENITSVARDREIVIQSLFCLLDGSPPPADEIQAYCDRLNEIINNAGRIKLVQIHTIARSPASADVASLDDTQLDSIANCVAEKVKVPVETYYGKDVAPQAM